MVKPDEVQFLKLMQQKGRCPFIPGCERKPLREQMRGLTPRDLLAESGLPAKRMWYILEKWRGKGWYDYGVCVDLGWLTLEGFQATFDA